MILISVDFFGLSKTSFKLTLAWKTPHQIFRIKTFLEECRLGTNIQMKFLLFRNCYYSKFSERCGGCRKPITGAFITALEQPWHEECFKCKVGCGYRAWSRIFSLFICLVIDALFIIMRVNWDRTYIGLQFERNPHFLKCCFWIKTRTFPAVM